MSIRIEPFHSSEVDVLSELSEKTFVESHGLSANEKDIRTYIDTHFNTNVLSQAFENAEIMFSKVYYNDQLAGYSKLILNHPTAHSSITPLAKFERLYLLKRFYGYGLGEELLKYNLSIAQNHFQRGLWLLVWTENKRGLRFYKKAVSKLLENMISKLVSNIQTPIM